jgi:hypothetical protein
MNNLFRVVGDNRNYNLSMQGFKWFGEILSWFIWACCPRIILQGLNKTTNIRTEQQPVCCLNPIAAACDVSAQNKGACSLSMYVRQLIHLVPHTWCDGWHTRVFTVTKLPWLPWSLVCKRLTTRVWMDTIDGEERQGGLGPGYFVHPVIWRSHAYWVTLQCWSL